jgi:hypothetical protein
MNMDIYCANLCQLSYSNSNINNSIFISDKETDCQCYINIVNKNVFITFRGTTTIEDWKHNIDTTTVNPFKDLQVHKGFYEQYMSVRNRIYSFIPNICSNNIIISGHSLGGALAYVCAVDIHSTTQNSNIKVFTIGAPRPGNKAFADYFNKNIKRSIRYKNKGDIITKLPLKSKFKHVHSAVCLDNGILVKDKKFNMFIVRLADTLCTCMLNINSLRDKHSVDLYIDNIQKYNKYL